MSFSFFQFEVLCKLLISTRYTCGRPDDKSGERFFSVKMMIKKIVWIFEMIEMSYIHQKTQNFYLRFNVVFFLICVRIAIIYVFF